MKFSVCLVLLVTVWQASAQAPGDEDSRCLNRRAQAGDIYPPSTKMLMDSRNYEELITGTHPHWQALNVDGSGRGWRSSLGGLCGAEPRSCDYTQSTSQNNWFFTQHIRYLDAREVFVNVSASFFQCSLVPSCSNRYFDVYRYERNERNDAAARTTSNYGQPIQRIQLPNGFIASELYNVSFTFTRSGNFNGFYIGVRDDGTCVDIRRLQVYYNKFTPVAPCPVICSETGLPPQGTTITVMCTCAANSVATSSPKLTCSSNGTCTSNCSCQCQVEYPELQGQCIGCPAGTYRSHSDSCLPCPCNTVTSGFAVTSCPCISGFFRTAQEGPGVGCTQPPTAVRNLRVNGKTDTRITIQWEPPQELGRTDYYYNVEYSDPTDITKYIQHNQAKQITNTNMYSVTGLQPVTTYIIRISVHNGVSGNDSQNDNDRRRQVSATTLEGVPSAPSSVQGLCVVVVWDEPSLTNGQLTGYDLRFYNIGYENIVSQEGDGIFRTVNETDVPSDQRGSTFVQVRGRTRAGAGNWSEGVPLGDCPTTSPGQEALICPPVVTCPPTPECTCPTTLPLVSCPTCPPVVECPSVACPTQLPATPPPPPAQIACVTVFYDEEKRTKLVTWDKPVGEVTVYSVRISYNDASSGQRMNRHRSSTNQWIKLYLISLPTERPLWIEVRAHNSGGTAHWSNKVELFEDEKAN